MMPHVAEIALANSAAPESITSHATVKVLGSTGYTVAVTGVGGLATETSVSGVSCCGFAIGSARRLAVAVADVGSPGSG